MVLLSAAAGVGLLGAYVAIVALLATAGWIQWGWPGAFALAGAAFALTAAICLLALRAIVRRRPSDLMRERADATGSGSPESIQVLIETVIDRMPPQGWITLISLGMSGMIALGPRRLMSLVSQAALKAMDSIRRDRC
jgi:hypothetical protein